MPVSTAELDNLLIVTKNEFTKNIAANPLTTLEDLKQFNKKLGEDHYSDQIAGMGDDYSLNTERILDYLLLHFPDQIQATSKSTKTYSGFIQNIYSCMNGLAGARDYMDRKEGLPNITSPSIYRKTALMTWLLMRIVNWSESNKELNVAIKKLIPNLAVDKIEILVKRLNTYERENKLTGEFSFKAINTKMQSLMDNLLIAEDAVSSGLNRNGLFTTAANPVASSADELDEKSTHLSLRHG